VLHVADLVDAACSRAGSDDFGAETWREGLDVLVTSLNTEASLTELGEDVLAGQVVDNLMNRLQVERWYTQHPEIEEQEITAPLFGLGLPRTGSTALSFLLAADPARRSLRTWEASSPCPPPETATEHTDPRIAASQAVVDLTNEMFPDFAGMLPSSATGPQECLLVMSFDFRSHVFGGMAVTPSYTEWLLSCDMEPAYRYHRRVLKLLQWRCPPTRWWLKTPSHMASIDALDAVYPDARFVMTHRDIGQVLPSVCAVKLALTTPLAHEVDPIAIGLREVELWAESLRRLTVFRDRGREGRFFDVSFDAVQREPLAAVEALYSATGERLSDEARRRMAQWWAGHAEARSRPARPDPAVFGLDRDELRSRFRDYHRRYGIESAT
jgi:hypothetical protein